MKHIKLYEQFVNEDAAKAEAEAIIQDLLDEHDPWDLVEMTPGEALDTVEGFGHKGAEAKKIAKILHNLISKGVFEATTSWSKMMKGVRAGGSGPWSIVAIQDRKVVGQSIDIKERDLIPAKYEALKREFPKAKLHIEDGGGMVVWTGPLNEGVSQDAVYIHQITGCGQDAAQNFIDDNGIDSEKLAAYVKQHRDSKEKYDVRDIIAGTGVGALKDFRKRFIKSVQESEINESTINRFEPPALDRKSEIDHKFFAKLMPKTEKTSDSATSHIFTFAGNTMFVHYQYFIVKPNGNSSDRPTYRIHNSQYWLNDTQLGWQGRKGESVNVTLLTIYDITDPKNEKNLGKIYVDTKVFLDELRKVFEVEDSRS